jgi:hypothetical protein
VVFDPCLGPERRSAEISRWRQWRSCAFRFFLNFDASAIQLKVAWLV